MATRKAGAGKEAAGKATGKAGKKPTKAKVKSTGEAWEKTARPGAELASELTGKAEAPKKPGKKARKQAKKLAKGARKKYQACTACGKRVRASCKKVFRMLWSGVLGDEKTGEPPVRYQCRKCGRVAPVAGFLCKPEPVA